METPEPASARAAPPPGHPGEGTDQRPPGTVISGRRSNPVLSHLTRVPVQPKSVQFSHVGCGGRNLSQRVVRMSAVDFRLMICGIGCDDGNLDYRCGECRLTQICK